MSVSAFQDLPLAEWQREQNGDAADNRVRRFADPADEPNEEDCVAHVWWDKNDEDHFAKYCAKTDETARWDRD